MQRWAAEEVGTAQFGDRRLTKRLVKVVEDLAAQPNASVPQACGSWAATKGAYRFWDSRQVRPEAIRAAHQASTVARLAGAGRILAVQDTTDLDYAHHPATKGVGPLAHPACQGLKVHSALALSAVGVPLGLLAQEVWARDPTTVGLAKQRRQRVFEEKESHRWVTTMRAIEHALPAEQPVLVVADREADIYELLAAPRAVGVDLLIRADHNRRVEHPERYVWPAIQSSPVLGRLTVELRRHDERPPRQASLTIRATTLTILPPRHHPQRASLPSLPVQVVLAAEEAAPPGIKPISWLLYTTLPVTTFDTAIQIVRWYTLRWLVERYHYVLKSGCHLEQLQLETAERLERALATYCIVAWRLLWLTYEARLNPNAPADTVLEAHEWQALTCTMTNSSRPPVTPPSLHQAVRWIAQLGGFLARKHDGQPGVKTIWRGLRRLHDISETWRLLHPPPPQLDTRLMGNA